MNQKNAKPLQVAESSPTQQKSSSKLDMGLICNAIE
jgi:hypothetical protein